MFGITQNLVALLLVLMLAACGGGGGSNNGGAGGTGEDPDLQSGGGGGGDDDGGTDGGSIGGNGDDDDDDGGSVDLRTHANLVVTPGSFDFLVQSVDSFTHKSFQIRNSGQRPAENLRVQGLSGAYGFRGGAYPGVNGTCDTRLIGGATCTVFITFAPTALGRYPLSTFAVLYNGQTNNLRVGVPLDGTATNISTLRFSNLVDDNTFSNFGTVANGVTVTKTIHVNYFGRRPASGVTFSGIAAPFAITSNTCSDEVSADCDLVISYTPSSTATTTQRLKVTYDNTSYAAEDNHDLTGTGAAQVTPAVLSYGATNFGKILVNTSADVTVTVSKSGTLPATGVDPRAFTNSVFTFKGGSFPGTGGTCTSTITANCTVVLRFTPIALVASSASLALDYHNGQIAALSTAALSGSGGDPAVLTLTPATQVNFGSLAVGQTTDQNFTLTNAANSVAATSLALSGHVAPFGYVSGCTGTLASGASCTLRMRFAPTAAGSFSSPITISYYDGSATQTINNSMIGTGTGGALVTAGSANYNFGNVLVNTTANATFTFNVFGTLPATDLVITGINAPFSFPGGAFPGGGTCQAPISSTCTVRVSFTPTLAQLYTTVFAIQYNDGDGQTRTVSMNLSGTGINPANAVLSFTPASVSYGAVAVGTTNNVTVTVAKAGNLAATSVSASGFSGDMMFAGGSYPGTGGTCGTTISAASCTMVLRFRPLSAQSLAQTLTLDYNDGTGPAVATLPITGTAVDTASLAFSGTTNLGSVALGGGSLAGSLTLTNSGTGAATALSFTLASPFGVTSHNCGATLAAGASCTVNVSFSSASPGQFAGSLGAAHHNGLTATSVSSSLSARVTVPVFVAVNGNHSCARNEIGQLKCWGHNNYGQLGLGDMMNRGDVGGTMGASLPAVNLGTGRYAKSVSLGYWHTCAILDNDALKCWGNNSYGQLGLGSTSAKIGIAPTHMGDSLPVVSLGSGRTAVKVAAGYAHTCALLDEGSVKCWGQNAEGQLGYGDVVDRGRTSGDMGNNLATVNLGTQDATAIAVNTSHSCALLQNNTVKCWGNNFYGQLGIGDFANRGDNAGEMGNSLPAVSLGTGATPTALTAGGAFTCVILSGGSVKCWGRNEEGILGRNYCQDVDGNHGLCSDPLYPRALRGLGILPGHMGNNLQTIDLGTGAVVTSLQAANSSVCASLSGGSVKCWGNNSYGQLGLGDTVSRGVGGDMGDSLPAVALGAGASVSSLHSGNLHSCVLLSNQEVKCWGNNRFGGLGYGDMNHRGDESGEMGNSLGAVGF